MGRRSIIENINKDDGKIEDLTPTVHSEVAAGNLDIDDAFLIDLAETALVRYGLAEMDEEVRRRRILTETPSGVGIRLNHEQRVFIRIIGEVGVEMALELVGIHPKVWNKFLSENAAVRLSYHKTLGMTERMVKFLSSYRRHLGNVAAACRDVHVDRNTYKNWFNNNMIFKTAIEDLRESFYDDVEETLLKKVLKDKDTTSIIWYTKTKMKERGYVERQELEAAVVVKDDTKHLTDAELEAEIKAMQSRLVTNTNKALDASEDITDAEIIE